MPVYFAKHETRDLLKIGASRRPAQRVAEMRLVPGEQPPFRMIGLISGDRAKEKATHAHFAPHRVPLERSTEHFLWSAIAEEIQAICASDDAVEALRTIIFDDDRQYRFAIKAFGGVEQIAAATRMSIEEVRADLKRIDDQTGSPLEICPARTVINAFGGVLTLASVLGRHYTRVYRWTLPVKEGGTGGLIPAQVQGKILDEARRRGLKLEAADLIGYAA